MKNMRLISARITPAVLDIVKQLAETATPPVTRAVMLRYVIDQGIIRIDTKRSKIKRALSK